jgi:hypothetical protein
VGAQVERSARAQCCWKVCSRTSRATRCCRRYAPPERPDTRAAPPVNWKRLSLAAALVYEPDGSDAHLVFELRPGADNGETLIDFLVDLHQLEPGRRMVLLRDGLPAHRGRCMTEWIHNQRAWLWVERLPLRAGAQSHRARIRQSQVHGACQPLP